jgi:hypothetical protein
LGGELWGKAYQGLKPLSSCCVLAGLPKQQQLQKQILRLRRRMTTEKQRQRQQQQQIRGFFASLRMTTLFTLTAGVEGGFADDGGYAGAEELDGVREFVVGEGGDAHLKADAGDAA